MMDLYFSFTTDVASDSIRKSVDIWWSSES